MKKDFWVLWTYSANYSKLRKVQAASAEEAAEIGTFPHNRKKMVDAGANIYVFDREPALMLGKNED